MSVDFPFIVRVIQWKIAPTLNIISLWQRFGRCVLNVALGVVLLFYMEVELISGVSTHPLYILHASEESSTPAVIIRMIEDRMAGHAALIQKCNVLDRENYLLDEWLLDRNMEELLLEDGLDNPNV